MADANEPTQTPGTEGGDGANQEPPVDYKALYEAEKKHSREWEKKAKANKTAAAALEEANNANKTAEDQIADLKKRLDDKEKEEKRSKIAAKVAQEKGVPASLIVGDDEESMSKWADDMLAAFKKPTAPKVEKPGSFPKSGDGDKSELRDFTRQLLGNN